MNETQQRKTHIETVVRTIKDMGEFDKEGEEHKVALAKYRRSYNWLVENTTITPRELFCQAEVDLTGFEDES